MRRCDQIHEKEAGDVKPSEPRLFPYYLLTSKGRTGVGEAPFQDRQGEASCLHGGTLSGDSRILGVLEEGWQSLRSSSQDNVLKYAYYNMPYYKRN